MRPPGESRADRARRYLPGIWVLRRYQRSWLRGDILAGVTVAAYLVPQVMAYAEVAGLPAVAGLVGCRRPAGCSMQSSAPLASSPSGPSRAPR